MRIILTISKHLEEAVSRLNEASWRTDQAREKPVSVESLREWLIALTDYTNAVADIQQANNESILTFTINSMHI